MNIAQIAKLAGVSSAAVSRYFNNGYISEEKKEAIRQVVEETGYRPSMQAQTLRTRKTMMVGVIAPRMASFSVGSIVDGLLTVLNESKYHMLLAVTQNDPKRELEYLSAFNDKQVDGVILIGTVMTAAHRKALRALNVPVVVIGQKMQGFCCVYHDDYHAMYDMTKHFLESGRRKIGYIGVMQQDKAVGTERTKGYKDAVTEAGYEELAGRCVISDFSFDGGKTKAEELLRAYPDLDGIICATDQIAVGALEYLRGKGIQVPQQIRLSGQGDSPVLKAADNEIDTIHYSYDKCGEMAAAWLLELLGSTEPAMREIKLGYNMVYAEQKER